MTNKVFRCMRSLKGLSEMAAKVTKLQEMQAEVAETTINMQTPFWESQQKLRCQKTTRTLMEMEKVIQQIQVYIGVKLLHQLGKADGLLSIEDLCDVCDLDIEEIEQLADQYDPSFESLGIYSWSITSHVFDASLGNSIRNRPICKCIDAALASIEPVLNQSHHNDKGVAL